MARRYRNRKKRIPAIIFILIFISFILFVYRITELRLKPLVMAMSEIKARLIATQAINDAVGKKTSRETFDNLIKVSFDNEGKVRLLQANTIEMNRIAVDTTLSIQNEITDIKTSEIRIPLSNIFGSQLFANMGPRISINIQPAGSVNVNFNPQFETAGINQTRLTIYLEVNTTVKIIAPLGYKKIEVSTQIPVSESIIVGDVPQSYISVPEDDYMNFVPTSDPFAN